MPRIEEYMRDINGLQMLYTDTMQSREQFREMFDLQLYDRMRVKYGAMEAFPDIYDKVRKMWLCLFARDHASVQFRFWIGIGFFIFFIFILFCCMWLWLWLWNNVLN